MATSLPKSSPDGAIIEKWKKSVVNLEVAADSDDYIKRNSEADKLLREGKLKESWEISKDIRSRDIRSFGTAIFLVSTNPATNEKEYLLLRVRTKTRLI